MPFGPASSAVTSDTSPLRTAKTPLNGSSFFGSANVAGRPNGGSVKYRVPSEAYTRSLGLFSRLPSYWSARTVMLPCGSTRITRRFPCWQMVSRPSGSKVSPFEPGWA